MKIKILAIAIASLWVSACAVSGANLEPDLSGDDKEMADQFMQTAQAFVQSAVGGGGNVRVFIKGDEATLIGYVDSRATKEKAERAALRDVRVSSVNNRIITN
ncbi:MAG: BON domain-containing protein [Granulosicoccus sp.]